MMNSKTRMSLTAFLSENLNKSIRYGDYNGITWATIKKYINMTDELVEYRHYVDPYEDKLLSSEGVLWDNDAELYYVIMSYHRYTILGWKE